MRQAVHEDVEQQLEPLVRVNRREVASQRREVGELPGRQRGEVAARIILGQLRGRAAVVPPVVPVRAATPRAATMLAATMLAATMLAFRGLADRARLGGRLVEGESVDDGDELVLAAGCWWRGPC